MPRQVSVEYIYPLYPLLPTHGVLQSPITDKDLAVWQTTLWIMKELEDRRWSWSWSKPNISGGKKSFAETNLTKYDHQTIILIYLQSRMMRSALCLRFSSWSTSAKIPRSILKDVFHKYRKVCDRKNVRRIRYPTVLLCGSFVFSPDMSVTQISPPETVSPKEVPAVRLWLVCWLDTVLVLVHCVRTLLVFTPLLLSSPLLLLPTSLRPSSFLLDLLGRVSWES